jgi:hypothetical protein
MNREEIVKQLLDLLANENKDSIEVGSASKGGAIKVYGNYDKPEEFKAKIESALTLREFAFNRTVSKTSGFPLEL